MARLSVAVGPGAASEATVIIGAYYAGLAIWSRSEAAGVGWRIRSRTAAGDKHLNSQGERNVLKISLIGTGCGSNSDGLWWPRGSRRFCE